ncbi:hypothetical protein BV25DRAFT_1921742 [Artomyces pyxidatus]|uniref:Uncharacterized protein n=1 Tax=Artomyces pyxidatus TaxID=48021 RepID=A0ACB8SG96_9AGAM|nr:hypothetical protein BV25DRAFT_1921742 [Artomyces pyxidatus]
MNVPRLVPGDEPGSFVIYLTRPGTFAFTLVQPGSVYTGLLRLAIINVATDGDVDGGAQWLLDSSATGAPYDSSSQTSSPVPTSQPDLDLAVSASRSTQPRSYSEHLPRESPSAAAACPQPEARPHSPSDHVVPSHSPSPRSPADSGRSSPSLWLDALMGLYPDRAHLEASIISERALRLRDASVSTRD